jgi:hypothetical protein
MAQFLDRGAVQMINRIKEEKLFFGVLFGLFFVLVLWNMFLRGDIADETVAITRSLQSEHQKFKLLAEKGQVTEEQLTPAREAMQDMNVKVTKLSDRIKYVRDPRFETPKDQTVLNHFFNLRIKSKELSEQAIKKGISWNRGIVQLNLKPDPVSDEEADEHLVRMDLVYRAIETLYSLTGEVGSFVQSIENINPMHNAQPGGTIVSKDRFLNKVSIQVKFRSNGVTAFRLVQALGNPERKGRGALNIEEFTAERPDSTVDLLDVTIVVSAVMVDVTKPLAGGGS